MSQPNLSDFPLVQPQSVAWGEMDAFGHVNNMYYYRYFESARINYLQVIGALDNLATLKPVVVANSCRYLKSVLFPDELEVAARVVELRASGFRMEYALISSTLKALVATGEAIVVMTGADGKKLSLPEEIRQAIINLEATVGNSLELEDPNRQPETMLGRALSRLSPILERNKK